MKQSMWHTKEWQLTSVHRARPNSIHTDFTGRQFLRNTTCEMLDRGFGARVRSVEAGESGQQGRDDSDDFAAVLDVLCAFFEDQKGGFRIDASGSF